MLTPLPRIVPEKFLGGRYTLNSNVLNVQDFAV